MHLIVLARIQFNSNIFLLNNCRLINMLVSLRNIIRHYCLLIKYNLLVNIYSRKTYRTNHKEIVCILRIPMEILSILRCIHMYIIQKKCFKIDVRVHLVGSDGSGSFFEGWGEGDR